MVWVRAHTLIVAAAAAAVGFFSRGIARTAGFLVAAILAAMFFFGRKK